MSFEFGPVQTEWLETLEKHPEYQARGTLGTVDEETHATCCLGELLLVACSVNGILPPIDTFNFNRVTDYRDGDITLEDLGVLSNSWKGLGLRSRTGELSKSVRRNNRNYDSLAEMNDGPFTWLEIAAYVRANPENVFTKSF